MDATGGRLYVDGALRSSLAWEGIAGAVTSTSVLYLGRNPLRANDGYFNGLLSEVTVWNAAHSQSQIMANMNRILGDNEPGLVAYYRFAEGIGNATADGALVLGGNNVGVLNNGPVWIPGAPIPPDVTTLKPNAVTSRSARLNGTARPNRTISSAWFEWGTTTNYGNVTPVTAVGAGTNAVEFNQFITGLAANVAIHYRAVASDRRAHV